MKCRISPQKDLLDLIVQWRRSGDVIQSKDSNKRSIVGEFDYTLQSANRKDAGVYQCVVISENVGAVIIDSGSSTVLHVNCKLQANGHSFILISVYMYIVEPILNIFSTPYFSKNSFVVIGYHKRDSLNCTADGYPRPRLIMSRNGKQINNTAVNTAVTFTFSSATRSNDGNYCCYASNKLGNRTACLTVLVKSNNEKCTIKSISNCFVVPSRILNFGVADKSSFLPANATVTLTCNAWGRPSPLISIYDPSGRRVQVHNPRRRPVETVGVGGELAAAFTFNTSSVKEGVYTCQANNSVGNVTSKHTLRLSGKMMIGFTLYSQNAKSQFFLH